MPKILIVEDSRVEGLLLRRDLEAESFDVTLAADGILGLDLARARRPDLVVLDLGLPGKNGHDVLKELRADERTRELPIIIASARGEEIDELIGFALGADDYVIKPYSGKLLIARIRALLRRRELLQSSRSDPRIESQGVMIDQAGHRVIYQGRELRLTPTEYRLLKALLRRPGRIFSRNELIDAAIGQDAAILEGTVNAYINGLRKKMGEAASLIETVRGFGYRFRTPGGDGS